MQERSSSMSVLLKQYMQSLQLSASKRKRSGAVVESSSQTSCDYPRHDERPCSAEARRRVKRKRATQSHIQPRRQSSTRRRACKGTQLSYHQKTHASLCCHRASMPKPLRLFCTQKSNVLMQLWSSAGLMRMLDCYLCHCTLPQSLCSPMPSAQGGQHAKGS